MPELFTYKTTCTDMTPLCFHLAKLRLPCQQHGSYIFHLYSSPQASALFLLMNMHVRVWRGGGGLKNVCIYVCAYIINFASANTIIQLHFLGVRTCQITLFLVISQTLCSLNFLMYLKINNKQKNKWTHIYKKLAAVAQNKCKKIIINLKSLWNCYQLGNVWNGQ